MFHIDIVSRALHSRPHHLFLGRVWRLASSSARGAPILLKTLFASGPSTLLSLGAVLLAVCPLTLASDARAEMLLAEITYTTPQVVAPASFVFGVGNSFIGVDHFHNWIETVPAFPYTSMADPATVAAFDRLLTTNTHEDGVNFGLNNGPYELLGPTFPIAYLDRAFAGAYVDLGINAIRYAPPIDVPFALQGYDLTAMERSVTATAQTIRIYGFAVPEPATWMLVICGALLHVSGSLPCLLRASPSKVS
jgi:hypothetical protein